MIFITLGSQKFQFNRLLEKIDKLIEEGIITEQVFAQMGASDYHPLHYKACDFLDSDDFKKKIEEADMVITHGGSGAIMGAVKRGKKVIAVPRLAKYNEHVDDHQLQLIKEFEELGIIIACYDTKELGEIYQKTNTVKLKEYHTNTDRMIESIEEFLNDMEKGNC